MTALGDVYRQDGEPVLVESVVLYADLLGVSEMARSPDAERYLRVIEKSVREVVAEWEDKSDFAFATFSDSLLIALPILDGDVRQPLAAILAAGATLQAKLILDGILMRGGVTVGDFSSQKHLVFGEALVRAAKELEDKIAKYPRIVIDREHHGISHELRNASFAKPEAKLVLHDEDGWPFINYFEGGIEYGFMIPSETTTFLRTHHELLLEQLARPELDDRVREKLEWASRAEAIAWPRCQKMYELAVALVMAEALIPASPKPAGHDLWIQAVGPETVKALLRS